MFELDFDICAAVVYLLAIFVFVTKKNTHNLSSKILMVLAINGFLSSLFDISSGMMLNNASAYSLKLIDIANYLYLTVHNSSRHSSEVYYTVNCHS